MDYYTRKKLLNEIILKRDHKALKKFILDKCKFEYTFSLADYWTDISYFLKIKQYVFWFEKYKLKIPLNNSIIYKITLNLFDYNGDVRRYKGWRCELCKIDCIKDKDLLDAHVNNSGLRGKEKKHIIRKSDLTVCCRVCHYNIDPKTHFNLDMNDDVYKRVDNLRKKLKNKLNKN